MDIGGFALQVLDDVGGRSNLLMFFFRIFQVALRTFANCMGLAIGDVSMR